MTMSAPESIESPPHPTGHPPERRGSDRRGPDRRSRPTSMFSRYSLVGGRRAGDRRRGTIENTYVDLYEPWLAGALVAIGLMCALDAVFTLLYIQKDGEEANPLMAALIEAGPRTFVLVKCGVTNLGLCVLCVHKNFRYVKPVIGALFGIYALLFAYHMYLAALVK